MTVIKQYNPGTDDWDIVLVGEKGDTGDTGATGEQGAQGLPGQGVPTGGGASMVLQKVSSADYDCNWFSITGVGQPVNTRGDSSYLLLLTDSGKVVAMTNASACTVVVPPNSSAAFIIGNSIDIVQMGTGQVTVTPSGAAVVRSPTGLGLKLRAQYSQARLLKVGTDEWVLSGDTAA